MEIPTIKLGYAIEVSKSKYSLKERIQMLSEIGSEAIEFEFTYPESLDRALDDEDVNKLRQFKYISIHAPILNSSESATDSEDRPRYSSSEADAIVKKLLTLAKKINASTVVFHPDLVDDFQWLNDKFGDLLAFENMDVHNLFGGTVDDMKKVFEKSPHAKWVFDVNHIYSIDPTMELAKVFFNAFSDRLCHYHLSGYGGDHDCFYRSHEDIIMKGITNFEVPILHEGCALRDGRNSLKKENDYILERLL